MSILRKKQWWNNVVACLCKYIRQSKIHLYVFLEETKKNMQHTLGIFCVQGIIVIIVNKSACVTPHYWEFWDEKNMKWIYFQMSQLRILAKFSFGMKSVTPTPLPTKTIYQKATTVAAATTDNDNSTHILLQQTKPFCIIGKEHTRTMARNNVPTVNLCTVYFTMLLCTLLNCSKTVHFASTTPPPRFTFPFQSLLLSLL